MNKSDDLDKYLLDMCLSGPFSWKVVHLFGFMVKKIVGSITRTFEFFRMYFIWDPTDSHNKSVWNYFV